ncbi:hypothetical protein L1987_06465 [Smallanthus sonchifolius]|uniref:Uncharacterized protein n=1 Tax=Smallanthus sonchifolius TaxID=185202 RepID=A0ACB9JYG7_9ASTR|nr:hypothetical protein L1987_06465 [Smallanthus sonchifolius]
MQNGLKENAEVEVGGFHQLTLRDVKGFLTPMEHPTFTSIWDEFCNMTIATGAVETGFDELHSIFDIGCSKGLPEYLVEKLPKITITSSNDVDDSGKRISCSVCRQVNSNE